MTWLNKAAVEIINSGRCPDCDYRGFVFGPGGASSQNIECGNLECRSRFNVARFSFSHHVVMAERIPKQSEGGSAW